MRALQRAIETCLVKMAGSNLRYSRKKGISYTHTHTPLCSYLDINIGTDLCHLSRIDLDNLENISEREGRKRGEFDPDIPRCVNYVIDTFAIESCAEGDCKLL